MCSVATCCSPHHPQGPDMPLSRLRKAIEECCPNLAGSVHIRWAAFVGGEDLGWVLSSGLPPSMCCLCSVTGDTARSCRLSGVWPLICG